MGKFQGVALEYLIKSFLSGSPASLIHSPGAYMAIPRLTNQPLDQKTLAGWYERSKDNLVFDSKQKKFIAQDSPDK
jgi:hypothetical protein